MKNKKVILIVIAAVLIVAAGGTYYFISKSGRPAAGPTGNPVAPAAETSSPSTTDSAPQAGIAIQGFAFQPDPLTVKKGTIVTWLNLDSVDHTVVSSDNSLPDLDSPAFGYGQRYSYTFNRTGSFGYHCKIHPSMTGVVVVE